jgi:uracil-DNA glycosylase
VVAVGAAVWYWLAVQLEMYWQERSVVAVGAMIWNWVLRQVVRGLQVRSVMYTVTAVIELTASRIDAGADDWY